MYRNPFPEVYVLGSPKAGTTALYYNLVQHSGIFASTLKEPNYFVTDFPKIRLVDDEESYLQLFADRGNLKAIDGSASSFYSSAAVDNILSQRPDAKFLIILRNPADMLFSLHGQTLVSLQETEENFEAVWADSDRRWATRDFGRHTIPQMACYKEAGRLGHYTNSLLRQAPDNQVHVMLLEDFQKDFRRSYTDLLDFLELPDDGLEQWDRVNEASERKFKTLVWAMTASSGPMGKTKRWLKKTFGLYDTKLMKAVHRATVRPVETKKELPADVRNMILEHFDEDIALLEQIIDADLRHWRSVDCR